MSDPLVDWVKEHLTSLYQKTTESSDDALPGLLAATFKSDAHIVYNHQRIDLTAFGDNLNKSYFAVTRADVEWKEAVALPNDESGEEKQTSIVAGCFIVTRSMRFRIRAAPAQTLQHCVFSARVEEPQVDQGQPGGSRYISELFVTSVNKQAPIHF